MRGVYGVGLGVVLACLALPSLEPRAMKLAPKGTRLEVVVATKHAGWFQRQLLKITGKGVDAFTEPVHEEITHRIYGCDGDAKDCLDVGGAPDPVLAGVRWNDDPPFRLQAGPGTPKSCKAEQTIRFSTQPKCWADIFRAAASRASEAPDGAGASSSLLERSHFGDLQFIHAMASANDEPPDTTRERILAWAEFTWRVGRGEIGLAVEMESVPVVKLASLFERNGFRVQDLFTLGNVQLRRHLADVAFGSLLHMVQDSFAKGHVDRTEAMPGQACGAADRPAPGAIREFHVYGAQDARRHGAFDSRDALAAHLVGEQPNVVSVGRALLEYRDQQATWEEVLPYVECIFRTEGAQSASAGAGFERQSGDSR